MNWRRWLLIILVISFFIFVLTQRQELAVLLQTLSQGRYLFLIAVFIYQTAQYFIYSYAYQLAFEIVGVKSRLLDLVPVIFASAFINNIAPAGGFGGAALLVDDAVLRGQSGVRAAVGVLLATFWETIVVLPYLILGLTSLLAIRQILLYQILAFAFYIIFVLILLTALLLGRWAPEFLTGVFIFLETQINRLSNLLIKRDLLAPQWAVNNAVEFIDASLVLTRYPREVSLVALYVFGSVTLNLLSLFFTFLAFGETLSLSALTAGYTLGYVFAVISFLPFDAALMQAIMILVYDSLGISPSTALAAVLVFGGISSWLPILIGFIFLTQVRSFRGK